MSPYQLFRLARLILLMLLGTVFLSLARGRPVSRRLRLLVLALLAVAALGYVNFGFFHPGRGHVHYWDAFHYFMGAKYLPELGYSKLYEATYAAGRELGAFDYITQLRDLETRANEVTILGAQPLGRIAELFGQIADNVTDVTTQIDNVSTSLLGNRSALEANARSLSALADQVRTLSGSFASDKLAAAIDSIRWLILALLVIAAIGAAVPAGGALVTGWWLRGWLRAGGAATPPPAPVSPFSA